MDRHPKYIIFSVFIIALFIAGSFSINLSAKDYFEKIKENVDTGYSSGNVDKGQEVVSIARPVVRYTAQDLKDPFKDYLPAMEDVTVSSAEQATSEQLPTIAIQGLIWGSNKPQAIIENKIVRVGDTVNGMTIVDINKEGLTVLYKNRKYDIPKSSYLVNARAGLKGG